MTAVIRRGYRWLHFPESLERRFRDEHQINAHTRVRMSLLVALITTTGFTIIDHWILRITNSTPDIVRFGLQMPVILTALLSTSRRFYMRFFRPFCYVGLPLFGLGTVLLVANAQIEQQSLVASRLLLVVFFCYFMLGMRMKPALACNLVVMTCFVVAGVLGYVAPATCIYLTFAMACANIIGSVGAYALEYASRTAFLERLQLEDVAARDGLTRLLNRQAFEVRAHGLWRSASAANRSIAILMIDVDCFKRYNDHYGHQAGDECLRRVATAVKNAVNPQRDELVARYGGEELIAMLADRSAEEVERIAAHIVDVVRRLNIPHRASTVGALVSVSVGACAAIADTSTSYNQLTHLADQSLYAAKHLGRNRHIMLNVNEAERQQVFAGL